MAAKSRKSETPLVDEVVAWLRERLPEGWRIEHARRESLDLSVPPVDSRISLEGPHGSSTAIVFEERDSLTPRDVVSLLSPRIQTARSMGGYLPFLVVAPWLSKRTQNLLAGQGLSYIDLTGNALLRIDNPPFYLQTSGADRNPNPQERGPAQLRGPRAARLIRTLIDVRPPYGVSELAKATGLAPGYVSRLLDTLYREALLERPARGAVESVDIAGLIRRWASSYSVFRSNEALSLIDPAGPRSFLEKLATSQPSEARLAVTGSFAASAMVTPVAPPSLLLAYAERPEKLAQEHGLLRSEEGANVVLLEPFDEVVWQRTSVHDRLLYAAPSQVVVDCLTGNGRMPQEGEALLEWMVTNEGSWREQDLASAGWDWR